MPELGGLKGETAPGDAHPYLALFCYLKKVYNLFMTAIGLEVYGGENVRDEVTTNTHAAKLLSRLATFAYQRNWNPSPGNFRVKQAYPSAAPDLQRVFLTQDPETFGIAGIENFDTRPPGIMLQVVHRIPLGNGEYTWVGNSCLISVERFGVNALLRVVNSAAPDLVRPKKDEVLYAPPELTHTGRILMAALARDASLPPFHEPKSRA